MGKPRRVVKQEEDCRREFLPVCSQSLRRHTRGLATLLLGIVSFFLTPQEQRRKIPASFSVRSWPRGTGSVYPERHLRAVQRERKKQRLIPEGEKECSTCLDGLYSASTRSAPLVATGCGCPTPRGNSAAIAALRSTTFRLRSGHACGCVPARLAVTVRRVVRLDDPGNRRERSSGALAPAQSGRAVPANSFSKQSPSESWVLSPRSSVAHSWLCGFCDRRKK